MSPARKPAANKARAPCATCRCACPPASKIGPGDVNSRRKARDGRRDGTRRRADRPSASAGRSDLRSTGSSASAAREVDRRRVERRAGASPSPARVIALAIRAGQPREQVRLAFRRHRAFRGRRNDRSSRSLGNLRLGQPALAALVALHVAEALAVVAGDAEVEFLDVLVLAQRCRPRRPSPRGRSPGCSRRWRSAARCWCSARRAGRTRLPSR